MEKEIRPIDANATIEALAANFLQVSADGCDNPFYQIAEDTIAEMTTITDHFHALTKMVPLTLEQLRGKRGEWVYIILIDGEPKESAWALSLGESLVTYLSYGSGKYAVKAVFGVEECGKAFLAYACPPARIDREERGCEYCTGDVDDRPFLDSEDLYISGDGWLISDGQDHDYCKIEYCPKCGKPLTQEAWAEQKKRLRG